MEGGTAMKRVMLMGAAVMALMLSTGAASAETTTVQCGGALAYHITIPDRQAVSCNAGSLVVSGAPSLDVQASLGPLANTFVGDIQVILESPTGHLEMNCLFRATSGFTPSCFYISEGDWTDPIATCTAKAAGLGEWLASCSNTVADA